MRDGPNERRDVTRQDNPGRRLMDRIRALDPTILDCGPECLGHDACGATLKQRRADTARRQDAARAREANR